MHWFKWFIDLSHPSHHKKDVHQPAEFRWCFGSLNYLHWVGLLIFPHCQSFGEAILAPITCTELVAYWHLSWSVRLFPNKHLHRDFTRANVSLVPALSTDVGRLDLLEQRSDVRLQSKVLIHQWKVLLHCQSFGRTVASPNYSHWRCLIKPFLRALSAVPHTIGDGVCLYLFGHVAHEAWVLVSTISRFQWVPGCATVLHFFGKVQIVSICAVCL